MSGIPDSGGPSGTFAALERHPLTPDERHGRALPGTIDRPDSPFEFIRNVTLEGREFWSARDLMPLLGYERWERFADAIGRAKVAAHNSGHDVAQNFPGAAKVSGARGPASEDYHLSRYACYLVALNGDPRKPEIAAAQTYFVIKTRPATTSAGCSDRRRGTPTAPTPWLPSISRSVLGPTCTSDSTRSATSSSGWSRGDHVDHDPLQHVWPVEPGPLPPWSLCTVHRCPGGRVTRLLW